jgi:hypothetical protein
LEAGLNIMVDNGPRTVMATGMLTVLAAYCESPSLLLTPWAYSDFVPMILSLRTCVYAEGKDGLLLACLHGILAGLLQRMQTVEGEILQKRHDHMFEIQQTGLATEELIEINTIKDRYDDYEDMCYELATPAG